jgi:hypothetical protein
MSTTFQWEGHNIHIHTQPAPKYLWLATETVVKVDGEEIGHSGGFGFTETLTGTFPHKDHSSELVLEMKVDLITLVSIPYKLEIDGEIISQGRLEINDWPLVFVPTALLTGGLCCPITVFLSRIFLNN